MKHKSLIAALLLLMAGVQTAWTQSMKVTLSGNRTVWYNTSDVASVTFSNNGASDGYEYVDLGLPSGTLWATCNIGASNPEDAGDYFAWGETSTKESFQWNNYKHSVSEDKLTKYIDNNTYYSTYYFRADYMLRLLPEDDAATANMGEGWTMPSKAQCEELVNKEYTTIEATTLNGVSGFLVTSKQNGNSIFLPATGYKSNSVINSEGESLRYWTRSRYRTSSQAMSLSLSSTSSRVLAVSRFFGLNIRPVHQSPTAQQTCQYVDLGLPSGTLWATCNVGASLPGECGDFFAWGETTSKPSYSWENYGFCNGTSEVITKYNASDNMRQLDPEDDAASANWGINWQMPTKEQFEELINGSYTTKIWTDQDDSYGWLIRSRTNRNTIFLPITGAMSKVYTESFAGFYWTRDISTIPKAISMVCDKSSIQLFELDRMWGHSVRPVWTQSYPAYDLGQPVRPVRKK